ncbi:MAG: glycosyltransferase family 2 protein, partial [Pseudomonadota bacterium]
MTSLLVLIPCLNEEKTIGTVIQSVPATIDGVGDIQIAIIDDGSTDRTAEIAQSHGAAVLHHGRNQGVGAALRTGLAHARRVGADITVSIDGDGQFDPAQIETLIAPLVNGTAEFATASRFKDPELKPTMPPVKVFGNRGIAWLVSSLTGFKMYDVSCGFRAYSREVVEQVHILGNFTYTHEIIMQLAFRGFRIAEIPLRVRGVREFGTSRVASDLWRYARQSSG